MVAIYSFSNQIGMISARSRLIRKNEFRSIMMGIHHRAKYCSTKKVSDVEAVSHTLGVRSVVPMPLIRDLRPHMLNVQTLPRNLPSYDQVDGSD